VEEGEREGVRGERKGGGRVVTMRVRNATVMASLVGEEKMASRAHFSLAYEAHVFLNGSGVQSLIAGVQEGRGGARRDLIKQREREKQRTHIVVRLLEKEKNEK